MANVVEQIRDAIDSEVRTATGLATTDRIRFIFDVERNDLRTIQDGFGVRWLTASPTESVTKFYTLDQGFEVILGKNIPRQVNDDDAIEAINALYDRADLIFKQILNDKLGIPAIVLNVSEPSIEEPEILAEGQYAVLRIGVTVKYRQSLS